MIRLLQPTTTPVVGDVAQILLYAVKGSGILDEKVVWRLVVRYARETELGKLAPHDLRRTCAKLYRKAGGELE